MKLLDYQIEDASWLAGKRHALLAHEMRVGKTPTVIEACKLVKARSILVVGPAVAREHWKRFFNEMGYTKIQVIDSEIPYPLNNHVCITSYGLIDSKYSYNAPGTWDVIILDESQYLKSVDAGRTAEVLGTKGIVHHAKHVWLLSGSPMMNNVSELWTILYVFGVTCLTYDNFIDTFCEGYSTPYGFKITGNKNVKELKRIMKNFYRRRTLKEVHPDLPPVSVSMFWLPEMTKEDKAFMMKTFPEEVNIVEGALADSGYAIDRLAEIQDSVSTLRRWTGALKVHSTLEYLKMMDYPKVVVFGIHHGTLEPLARELGNSAVLITGKVPPKQRLNAIKRFKTDATCKYLIGNLISAGTCEDYSVANYVIILEASWVPKENEQAIMRIVNFNKPKPVFAQFLGMVNSIDGVVQAVACRKAKMIDEIFN